MDQLCFIFYSPCYNLYFLLLYYLKIIRFQFKIDDVMAIYPGCSRTNIKNIALNFSLWLSLSLTCTFMRTIVLQHHMELY